MTPVETPAANTGRQFPDTFDHQPKLLVEGNNALLLDSGVFIGPVAIAYQTYGNLNSDKSNAILVCHALTGDQYVAGIHPVTGRPGWWNCRGRYAA